MIGARNVRKQTYVKVGSTHGVFTRKKIGATSSEKVTK